MNPSQRSEKSFIIALSKFVSDIEAIVDPSKNQIKKGMCFGTEPMALRITGFGLRLNQDYEVGF
jgi:hypothetical protein